MKNTVINLSAPLNVGGKNFVSLNMRASTVGDEEDAQAMAVDLGRPEVSLTAEICLFSLLTGATYDDLRALPPQDYEGLRLAYHRINASAAQPPVAGRKRGKVRLREAPQAEQDAEQEPEKTAPEPEGPVPVPEATPA